MSCLSLHIQVSSDVLDENEKALFATSRQIKHNNYL